MLYTQNVIAFIWDFDKTLTHEYMQDPLFDAYYAAADLKVSRDSAYLWHILSYVRHGVFAGLTNERLRELGALIPLADGMPDFMTRTREVVREDARYRRHDITV